jgi:outer membrane protein assembly factor BamB
MRIVLAVLVGLAALVALPRAQTADTARYWPQWRGPHAKGVSHSANPPLRWSESENILWKVVVPGRGSSSPVVWGERLFMTTAVPVSVTGAAQHEPRGGLPSRGVHRFVLMALDRATGRTIWERTAREQEPHEAAHTDNGTWASGSPITDGQRVFAYFESFGLYAYDMDGRPLWSVDLGDKRMRNQFGEGSTPVLYRDTLVVVWDHLGGDSFVAALDARDGRERWRVPRQEIDTWATPVVVEANGRPQVVVPAMRRVRAYDLESGAVVWEMDGLTMNPIPSPVTEDGILVLMSGFQGNDAKAIRYAEAKGNIDGTSAILWSLDRDTPYVPSPLLYDGILYFLKSNSGILSAYDARSGKPHYVLQRLDGVPNVFASPVGAGGRVYFPGRDGTTLVIRHGPSFEVLASNTLDDGFDASPALVDDVLYMRGYRNLYAIAQR